MDTERRRVTVELEADIERQVKQAAARRGVSVSSYCEEAIKGQVEQEETSPPTIRPRLSASQIIARRDERFRDKAMTGDSVQDLRDIRAERDAQLNGL